MFLVWIVNTYYNFFMSLEDQKYFSSLCFFTIFMQIRKYMLFWGLHEGRARCTMVWEHNKSLLVNCNSCMGSNDTPQLGSNGILKRAAAMGRYGLHTYWGKDTLARLSRRKIARNSPQWMIEKRFRACMKLWRIWKGSLYWYSCWQSMLFLLNILAVGVPG